VSDTILEVDDLVVDYGSGSTAHRAVDHVSFSVRRGSTFAIVGESGCGKSTIAKAVMRLLQPTSGRIVLDGTDLATLSEARLRPLRHRFQMVFQDPYGSLDPHLSARDIVAEPLRLKGVRSAQDRATEAARLIDRVGLPSTALDRRPHEFSGGQRQRIGIARALASSPDLLREIQVDTGITYVVISHNLGVVQQISESVLVMKQGAVVEQGATAQVLTSPAEDYTRRLRRAALDPATMTGVKPRHVVRSLSLGATA
jgi:ABC-type glutathione transport system ATPase component